MKRRSKGANGTPGNTSDSPVALNVRVRVYPGTDGDVGGTVVEAFGEMAAQAVDIRGEHFADPARRWAVQLDTGDLVFVNTDQLVAE
jgi:hypothetical protein